MQNPDSTYQLVDLFPQDKGLFTLYCDKNGEEIAVSFATKEYAFKDSICQFVSFVREAPLNFIWQTNQLPEGQEWTLRIEEFSVVLMLFRNLAAKRPFVDDLHDALTDFHNQYVYNLLQESNQLPDWLPEKEDSSITDWMLAILRKLNRGNVFGARYLVRADPPWATDDIDLAMEKSIRVNQVPLDLGA